LTHLATPGDLTVAPLGPLGIGQEQQDGFPLIGVGPRQAVLGVGRNGALLGQRLDEEFLINPSAKSLGGLWRSWRISEKIRLSRQVALERSSTG
jgi:hypothetical protein